jgi:hypothetical protein
VAAANFAPGPDAIAHPAITASDQPEPSPTHTLRRPAAAPAAIFGVQYDNMVTPTVAGFGVLGQMTGFGPSTAQHADTVVRAPLPPFLPQPLASASPTGSSPADLASMISSAAASTASVAPATLAAIAAAVAPPNGKSPVQQQQQQQQQQAWVASPVAPGSQEQQLLLNAAQLQQQQQIFQQQLILQHHHHHYQQHHHHQQQIAAFNMAALNMAAAAAVAPTSTPTTLPLPTTTMPSSLLVQEWMVPYGLPMYMVSGRVGCSLEVGEEMGGFTTIRGNLSFCSPSPTPSSPDDEQQQ